MFRLNGQDAYMLYQDTPTTPMHTLKILVGRHAGRTPGVSEIKQAILANLESVPGLRRRIVWVPLGLHHPVVIDDPEFDIDLHVHRIAAPAPGGSAELDEAIAQISSNPLDHSRPLWDLWMIEGLAGGRVAYAVKLHHAIADGQAVVNQLEQLFAAAPSPAQDAACRVWRPEPIPSVSRLVVDALRDQLRDVRRLPALIGRTFRSVRRIFERWQAGQLRFPLPKDVPSTPFNRSLCGQRDFATVRCALADFRAIKSALGGTVNDVVVAVVAGALREYLLARGSLPEQPLVSSIPAAGIEVTGARRVFGNTASGMPVFVRTDLDDPRERYAATRQALAGGKEFLELLGRDAFHNWTAYVPPLIYSAWQRLRVHFRLAERRHGDINVIISNVPGPRVAGVIGDFALEELISGGPLMEGMALNITAWSFGEQLNFGLVACRRAVPDLPELAARLRQQPTVLLALAARLGRPTGEASTSAEGAKEV